MRHYTCTCIYNLSVKLHVAGNHSNLHNWKCIVTVTVISGGKRLICKANCWFSATSVLSDTKTVKVPKLPAQDLRSEKEGFLRFESLKEERRNALHNSISLKSRTFDLVEGALSIYEGTVIYSYTFGD